MRCFVDDHLSPEFELYLNEFEIISVFIEMGVFVFAEKRDLCFLIHCFSKKLFFVWH